MGYVRPVIMGNGKGQGWRSALRTRAEGRVSAASAIATWVRTAAKYRSLALEKEARSVDGAVGLG